eukprot:TRINITY_DN47640_c0_g1_i1.p1 TRINITY_DN47640_c0_g1~~TRINITY_DN47640_c0_g1_i1.p1  ORF type:complete len:221 (+),score=30.34 TRINITY_DN47640_c0_g1_i1:199-861(+)
MARTSVLIFGVVKGSLMLRSAGGPWRIRTCISSESKVCALAGLQQGATMCLEDVLVEPYYSSSCREKDTQPQDSPMYIAAVFKEQDAKDDGMERALHTRNITALGSVSPLVRTSSCKLRHALGVRPAQGDVVCLRESFMQDGQLFLNGSRAKVTKVCQDEAVELSFDDGQTLRTFFWPYRKREKIGPAETRDFDLVHSAPSRAAPSVEIGSCKDTQHVSR